MAELVRPMLNGLLFKVGNPKDLHARITRLIENAALVTELSANAPAVKAISENDAELKNLYESVIANGESR